MKPADLTGIILVAFLAGGFLTFLGSIIRFFNAGDMLNFFDDKKHDKYKTSKVVGRDLLITGLSIILIAIVSIFIDKKYYNFIMVGNIFILIIGIGITYYQFLIHCKKEDNNHSMLN